jgi:hypothetical protein
MDGSSRRLNITGVVVSFRFFLEWEEVEAALQRV